MLRFIAVLIGIAFIFVGVASFFPVFIHDGLLFGVLGTNIFHSFVRITSGVVAIMCATSYASTRWFFIVFGVIYALIAVLGFLNRGDLWLFQVNTMDNVVHLVIAAVLLFLGFSAKKLR